MYARLPFEFAFLAKLEYNDYHISWNRDDYHVAVY